MPSPMGRALSSRHVLTALGAVAVAVGAFAVWVGLRVGGTRVTLWIDDGFTPVAALIASVSCWRARSRHAGRIRMYWTLLGCATASWTFAEIVWGSYALRSGAAVPVVSWADVGYLGAIPLAVAALMVHPATHGGGGRTARSLFDSLIVATALLFLSWTLALGPLWRSGDPGTWAGIVALAYPFGDVVIVFFIVLAIRGMSGGGRLSLWSLLAALLVMALSDSTYTYLTASTSYTSPGLIDTGWVAAYLGIAFAALCSQPGRASLRRIGRTRPSLPSVIAPLVVMLLALAVAAVEITLGHHLDRAAWLMLLALVVLVLVRQALILLEVFAPGSTGVGLTRRLERATLGDAAGLRPSGGPGGLP